MVANASIFKASQLSGAVSELSGADSDSSGEALGWSATKYSDTTSSKPSHYGPMEDSSGDIYRSPESSVRGGGCRGKGSSGGRGSGGGGGSGGRGGGVSGGGRGLSS